MVPTKNQVNGLYHDRLATLAPANVLVLIEHYSLPQALWHATSSYQPWVYSVKSVGFEAVTIKPI